MLVPLLRLLAMQLVLVLTTARAVRVHVCACARYCDVGEACNSCPADCGSCPPSCGDGTCEGAETCASCTTDCGAYACEVTCAAVVACTCAVA